MKYFIFVVLLMVFTAANAVENQQLVLCKTFITGQVFVAEGSCPSGSRFIGYA